MPKIGFNPKAQGRISLDKDTDVRGLCETGAFVPVVVQGVGIEAVKEGLRLANIQGVHIPRTTGPTKDVDPA